MNISHWLLTTHAVALFPMGVFLWSWKRRRDTSSIFMLIKFIYGVTFSLLYHSHHSLPADQVFTTDDDYDNWALLDSYACSSLIFTTVLYGLRVREPQFYIKCVFLSLNAIESRPITESLSSMSNL